MSNSPYTVSTEKLSAPIAAAVEVIAAAFASKASESNAFTGAQSFAEAVEKLRSLNV